MTGPARVYGNAPVKIQIKMFHVKRGHKVLKK